MTDANSLLETPRPGQMTEEVRLQLRQKALNSLFFFNKVPLDMHDLTINLHGKMCDHMQADVRRTSYKRRKLCQTARGHLKSSIGNLGKRLHTAVRFLTGEQFWFDDSKYHNMVACSTATNAQRFSTFDKENLEKPFFRWLFPDIVPGDKFSETYREIIGLTTGRKVVFEYIGVGGKASSRHVRILTLDDMHAAEEGDDAKESTLPVDEVVRWYGKTDALLVEPEFDLMDVMGTNCSINPPDAYICIREKEAELFDIFPYSSCYDDEGNPVWPERFPHHVLAAIRKKMGDEQFAKNYLNNPLDESITEFRSNQFLRFSIADTQAGRIYYVSNGKKYHDNQLAKVCMLDLAGWRGKGDKNAICLVGRAADGMSLVLRSWKKRNNPREFMDKMFEMYREERFDVISVEEVAYQQCLSFFIEEKISKEGLSLRHKPCKPHGESTKARVRAMMNFVNTGQVAIGDSDTLFLEEATRFPRGEDHILSAWAYAPQVWDR